MHHVLLRLAATDGRQVVPQGQQQRYRRIKLALHVTMSFHDTHRHTCHASQSTVGRERSTRGEHGRDIYRKKEKKKKRAKMLASVRNNSTFAAYNYGGWRGLSRFGHTLQYSVRKEQAVEKNGATEYDRRTAECVCRQLVCQVRVARAVRRRVHYGDVHGTRGDAANPADRPNSPRGRRPSPRTRAGPRALPPTSCLGEGPPHPCPPPPEPHLVRPSDSGRSGRSGAGPPLLPPLLVVGGVVLLVARSPSPRFERTLP